MAWRYQGRISSGPYTGLWRVGLSIETIGKQVDALWPGRGKASDGTLGNTAHQNRRSDHNPNILDAGFKVVTAIDITDHDASGADMAVCAEAIRVAQDARVKYCIHNRRMFASYTKPHRAAWEWGPYTGSNAHLSHMHLSVSKNKALYDDGAAWPIGEDQEDNDVEYWITLLKAQADPYWPALQAATGSPAGDPMYWSQTGTADGSKASDAEWLTAAPELSAASLQAGVMATGGDMGDVDTLVDTAIAEHADNPDAHHA